MAPHVHETDLPVAPGKVVAGKYRVDKIIGAGGMGYVVAARHVHLNQRVAIKFLHADSVDDPDSETRFMREAQAAVALTSEHVARVHDVGALESGAPFIVMEYLEGESLAARLAARAPLNVAEVMAIAKQACTGLAEAHRSGIVHRDVKPANLFLTRRDGREVLKVLDFGIAKMADPLAAAAPQLTSTSQVLGTPRYMSPEQLSSTRDVGPPTDVWALGVTLYECLTGRPAFQTGSAFEVGARILSTDLPRLSTMRPDIPSALDEIVERCLRKDPAERFADAGAMLAALEGGAMPALAGADAGLGKPTAPMPLPETRISDRIAVQKATHAMTPPPAQPPLVVAAPTTKETTSRVAVLAIAAVVALLGIVGVLAVSLRRAPVQTEAELPAAVATAAPSSSSPGPAPAPTADPGVVEEAPPVVAASAQPPVVRRAAPGPRRGTAGVAPRPTAITRPPDER